jgi:hypothetical protein
LRGRVQVGSATSTTYISVTRLPRDHYVRLDSNDYSVHPCAIGRRVDISADLEQVTVTCDGRIVAEHQRCWADHQTITDPVHAAAAAEMRQARRLVVVARVDTTVEHRSLADYDRMFGLDQHNTTHTAIDTATGTSTEGVA